MRRLLASALLLTLAACTGGGGGPQLPEPVPTSYPFTIVVCEGTGSEFCTRMTKVPGARFLVDGVQQGTTNTNGFAEARLPHGPRLIRVEADGYQPRELTLDLTRRDHRDVRLERDKPALSRIRTDGRFFVNDGGTYRGLWTSALAILAKPPPERAAFLDWAARTGFDGLRVFAGALSWAGQTPASARAALPALLLEAEQRGLYVYVVAVTDSATGYDVESHLRQVAQLCAAAVNCVLEAGNELGHSTQSALVNDIRQFEQVALRVIPVGLTWSLGAMLGQDEPSAAGYPPNGAASFNTSHLDRSRDKFNQVRRVREILGISELTGKPAVSGEPIGAAETTQPGRRESDPAFFFAYGALCRLFELGACVLHSEDALFARQLGPVQQQCAEAFLAGFGSIPTTARLGYRNSGWSGGDVPVKSFTHAVRVYAGVTGNEGYVVVVGDEGVQVTWQNGYRVVAELGRMPGVIVWKVAK